MRKGKGKGKGKGYHNIVGKDPFIHGQSAKGIKQPQKFSMTQKKAMTRNLNLKDTDGDGVADKFDCRPNDPKMQDEDLNISYDDTGVIFEESKEINTKGILDDTINVDEPMLDNIPKKKSRLKDLASKGWGFGKDQYSEYKKSKKDKVIKERESVSHPLNLKHSRQEERVSQLRRRIDDTDDWEEKEDMIEDLENEERQLSEIKEEITNISLLDYSDGQLKTLAIRWDDDDIFGFSGNPYTRELKRRINNKKKVERELTEQRKEPVDDGIFDGLF